MKKLFTLIFLSFSFTSFGQNYYPYHPAMKASLDIGKGFNPLDLAHDQYQIPFNLPLSIIPDIISKSKKYDIKVIKTHQDLLQTFSLDAYIDAKYPNYSLNAELGIKKTEISNRDNLVLCFVATASFGNDKVAPSHPLNQKAQELLDQKKFNELFTLYGDYIVTQRERKKSAYLFVTINNFYKNNSSITSASLEAQVGSSGSGISIGGQVRQLLNASYSNKEMIIKGYEIGKFDLLNNHQLIEGIKNAFDTSNDFVAAVNSTLSSYLNDLNDRNSSSITGFYYTTWQAFGVPQDSLRIDKVKIEKYNRLEGEYREIKNYQQALLEIKDGDNFRSFASEKARQALKKENGILSDLDDEYNKLLSKCRRELCSERCCTIPPDVNEYKDSVFKTLTSAFSNPFKDFNYLTNKNNTQIFDGPSLTIYKRVNNFNDLFHFEKNSILLVNYKLALEIAKNNTHQQQLRILVYANDQLVREQTVTFAIGSQRREDNFVTSLSLDELGGSIRNLEIKIERLTSLIQNIKLLDSSFISLEYRLP